MQGQTDKFGRATQTNKKWEYETTIRGPEIPLFSKEEEDLLKERGLSGWELVSIIRLPDSKYFAVYYWKREML